MITLRNQNKSDKNLFKIDSEKIIHQYFFFFLQHMKDVVKILRTLQITIFQILVVILCTKLEMYKEGRKN